VYIEGVWPVWARFVKGFAEKSASLPLFLLRSLLRKLPPKPAVFAWKQRHPWRFGGGIFGFFGFFRSAPGGGFAEKT
jgi:hypothetical protein